MNTYTLVRDGQPDLRFRGELLGEASSHSYQGPRQNRWHEVSVYRTTSGRYLAHVVYSTQWQGESGSRSVEVATTPRALLDLFAEPDVVDLVKDALAVGGVEAAEELGEDDDEGGES
jgi:hypothetical protein